MNDLSEEERRAKLATLAEATGYASFDELIEASVTDSVCPAICTEPGCSYTTDMEPDQDRGWCEACGRNTAASALVLAGFI